MFLFDNILFNSFIPQLVLMAIFVYCNLSALMSNFLDTGTDIVDMQIANMSEHRVSLEDGQSVEKTFHLFDFVTDGIVECTEARDIQHTECIILHMDERKKLLVSDFFSVLFSRPPPTHFR